jgi:hypothetical protein
MQKLYAFLFLLLLGACAPGTYSTAATAGFSTISPTFYYVTAESAPLSESAKTANPVIKYTVPRGEKLLVVGQGQDGWVMVRWDGVTYYTLASLLSTETPSPAATAPAATGASSGSYRTINTGPRGGRYYINKNGNKTYIKRK